MQLVPLPPNPKAPRRIRAIHEREPIADVLTDGCIRFLAPGELPVAVVAELVIVAQNFRLFYENLKNTTP